MSEHLQPRQLDDYVERALGPDQQTGVEQHLAICPECRKRLAGHQRLMALAAHIPMEPMPAHLISQVQFRLAQAKEKRWKEVQRSRLGWTALGFAIAGLILLGAAWQQVVRILTVLLNQFENNLLTTIWQNLVTLLAENWPELAQTELNWQSQLAKDVDAVLLAGAIFLSLAAFAGLARMLLSVQNSNLLNSEE